MTHLLRMTPVEAPFSSVIEYAADFFEAHPHLQLKVLASTTAATETRFKVISDRTDGSRQHDALALSWRPRWRLFPNFEGSVTVRPHRCGSILGLEGNYQSPGGFAGQLFDRILGQKLANGTLDQLLQRLRRYIEGRYREYQAGCPTIDQLNDLAHVSGE